MKDQFLQKIGSIEKLIKEAENEGLKIIPVSDEEFTCMKKEYANDIEVVGKSIEADIENYQTTMMKLVKVLKTGAKDIKKIDSIVVTVDMLPNSIYRVFEKGFKWFSRLFPDESVTTNFFNYSIFTHS